MLAYSSSLCFAMQSYASLPYNGIKYVVSLARLLAALVTSTYEL
jgi:hypothetical protein